MSVIRVAKRYAEALADVAISRNEVDAVQEDLKGFADLIRPPGELHELLASPAVSHKEKAGLLDTIIERTRPHPVVVNLLRALLRRDRLHNVEAVYSQFIRGINERSGIVVADVITAAELPPTEQNVLRARLEALTSRTVDLRFKTDPDLIGGVITRIESIVYDGSIRTQLRIIKERLKQVES